MSDESNERRRRLGHRPDATVPVSVYRLQLNSNFTFWDAKKHLDYFESLGVSHLYLSPILTAAPGSSHGYDVVDHARISEERGGEAGLRALADAARERGMGVIVDIVPNHMAVPTPAYHNKALWSVLAQGRKSPYSHWFDVDWSSGDPVLMPVLAERLGTCLALDEISVSSMVVPGFEEDGEVPVLTYLDHVFPLKPGTESLPLTEAVDQQPYRLAYWRVANEEVNYRRFFDVQVLAAIRVEDPRVFDATHAVIVQLVREGVIDGLRIDHPDGLSDPAGYLDQLADATNDAWVVAEKILEEDERLPSAWRVAGSTGYDASWRIGALLRDPAGEAPLAGTLHKLTGDAMGSLPAIIGQAKSEIVDTSFRSEIQRLATLAHGVCTTDVRLRDHTLRALDDCLTAMLVAFDRYRTYVVRTQRASPSSLDTIDRAAARAQVALDPERFETLEVVVDLLKGAEVGSAGRRTDAARCEFVTRFQQLCSSVMAKGVEDTAYYRWTLLLPLCEVGSPAARFALPPTNFHAWAIDFLAHTPDGMTTLTTHDTKRSEDVRATLGVLSEWGDEWDILLTDLRLSKNPELPAELDGRTENLWWQTLAGTWGDDGPMAWGRLRAYMTKAIREMNSATSWLTVNERYETAVLRFCHAACKHPDVRDLLNDWHTKSQPAVRTAILSQKAIQVLGPGVPDVYWGNEAFSLNLVDPDNRRNLDFAQRSAILTRLDAGAKPRRLSDEKLWVAAQCLRARRDHTDAFIGARSGYHPLLSSSGHAVAFARTVDDEPLVLAIATRAARSLERLGGWGEATVHLPDGRWLDTLTGDFIEGGAALLSDILRQFPVALLVQA